MSLLVDTSVWSLALCRDAALHVLEVVALPNALLGTDQVFSTGLVLQELVQGFAGPKARESILERFTALAFIEPGRQDHVEAAEIRNSCRRNGVQIGTIDAPLIQISRKHDLQLLTTDNDFRSARLHIEFNLWSPSAG